MIKHYDTWKLGYGGQDEESIGDCEYCDGEIFKNRSHLRTKVGLLHTYCFSEFSSDYLDAIHIESGVEVDWQE